MIDRRTFLAGTGAVLLAAPLAAEAQRETVRIGYLSGGVPERPPNPLAVPLRALGWVEGQNLVFESRYDEGKRDRLSLRRCITQGGARCFLASRSITPLARDALSLRVNRAVSGLRERSVEPAFVFLSGVGVTLTGALIAHMLARRRERRKLVDERRFEIYMKLMDLNSQYSRPGPRAIARLSICRNLPALPSAQA